MNRAAFQKLLAAQDNPPAELTPPLQALWQAAKGHWHAAHERAQQMDSPIGYWIHAHLHREEGDLSNAAYWYDRAGKPIPSLSIAQEREAMIEHFLNRDAN